MVSLKPIVSFFSFVTINLFVVYITPFHIPDISEKSPSTEFLTFIEKSANI